MRFSQYLTVRLSLHLHRCPSIHLSTNRYRFKMRRPPPTPLATHSAHQPKAHAQAHAQAHVHAYSEHELHELTTQGLFRNSDGAISWLPDSRDHPRNWSAGRKVFDISVIIFLEFFVSVSPLPPLFSFSFSLSLLLPSLLLLFVLFFSLFFVVAIVAD